MHFAKLFTYETGQLLVTVNNSDNEADETPYQMLTETRLEGVSVTLTGSYKSEAHRDEQFLELGEAKALDFFTKQQALLREATA